MANALDPLALVAVDQMKKRNLVKCLVQIQILSSLLPSLVSALRSDSWVFGVSFYVLWCLSHNSCDGVPPSVAPSGRLVYRPE